MSGTGKRRRALALAALLTLYVAGVVLGAGLLSVPLQHLLTDAGFHDVEMRRTVHRLAEALALAGLVPLLALTGGVSREALGLSRGARRAWLTEFGLGLAAGVASLGVLALVLLAFGLRVPRPDLVIEPAWLARVVLGAVATAALVSLIEELWFRGGLHTLVRRLAGPLGAIGTVATIYAVVHFVRPPSLAPGAVPAPLDGLALFARSLGRFEDPSTTGPLLALLAAGVLLGLAREHTGRIAACIGLHAGWVLVIRVLKKTTHVGSDPSLAWLAEGYDGVIGWLALAWFVALAVVYARRVPGLRSP